MKYLYSPTESVTLFSAEIDYLRRYRNGYKSSLTHPAHRKSLITVEIGHVYLRSFKM